MSIVKQRRLQKLWAWAHAQEANSTETTLCLAVAAPYFAAWQSAGRSDLLDWLKHSTPPEISDIVTRFSALARNAWPADCADFVDSQLYEQLLAISDHQARRRRGVYFTPLPLADFLVRELERELIETFGFTEGYADERLDPHTGRPCVRLLDPALGSGIFLCSVLRHVASQVGSTNSWSKYVAPALLLRLHGWELMLPALLSAVLQLTNVLAETNFDFQQPIRLPWRQRDALAPPTDDYYPFWLGNPPYGSLSTAKHGWIEALISHPQHGYVALQGTSLREKKHWLHDEYVKFFRLAQWHVDHCDYGAVAFVTNHSYLENVTFRGMRAALHATFPRGQILDLQGNAKRKSRTQASDENVFGIASGVAASLLVRPPQHPLQSHVAYTSLWGSKQHKLATLADSCVPQGTKVQPQSPLFLFLPRLTPPANYNSWPAITEIMPFAASVPVTARDHFVVAFERADLIARLQEFADLNIPAELIRQRWFQRTRSARYPSGDTRGWKLSAARWQFAADPHALECIRPVQYRPLDIRWVAWHPALIDWPRHELCRHLFAADNMALIVRRQSPDHLPAQFFWATKLLPLDGILRSDQRGNETVLPLWLYEHGTRRANFASAWLERLAKITGLDCRADSSTCTPEDCLGYIYSQFFSLSYRKAFQAGIVHDYPRVPDPHHADDFLTHAKRGRKLLALQTSIRPSEPTSSPLPELEIVPGYPCWSDGKVWINPQLSVAAMEEYVWNLSLGAHQVARKWLKDRRGRPFSKQDMNHYQQLVSILRGTQQMLSE